MEWFSENNNITKENCLSYIRFWVNSIIMHTLKVDEKGMNHIAPIVLIGTKKDKISDPNEHVRISSIIYNMMKGSPAWPFIIENENGISSNGKIILTFFPINNIIGRNDPTIIYLMQTIEQTMINSEYVNVNISLAWLQAVDLLFETKQSVLSLNEVQGICEKCFIFDEKIDDFLVFLHEIGYLLWINEPHLRDIVILDPIEFFVTPASNVICKHNMTAGDPTLHVTQWHKTCRKKYHSAWLKMTDHGLVSNDLLESLVSEKYTHESKVIISLMIKFGLIVPIIDQFDTKDHTKIKSSMTEYLVPSILPSLPMTEEYVINDNHEWSHFGYFIFTLDESLYHMKTLSLSMLETRGFLPKGLFERLICKVSLWSNYTSPSSIPYQTKFYNNMIITNFGAQRLKLNLLPEVNCIEFSVDGLNPLAVYKRLEDLLNKLMDECMNNLKFFLILDLNCNEMRSIQLNKYHNNHDNIFIPYHLLCNMIESKSQIEQAINLPHRNILLTSSDIIKIFGSWLSNSTQLNIIKFDTFISYRWGKNDSLFVNALYDKLTFYNIESNSNGGVHQTKAIDIFLDTKRLKQGEAFQLSFAQALVNSIVFIPIVSYDGLFKMLTHDPSTEDNVLIEWIIALLLVKIKNNQNQNKDNNNNNDNNNNKIKLCKLFPLLFGSIITHDNNHSLIIRDLFHENIISNLPEVIPLASIRKVSELLEAIGIIPSVLYATWTVQYIVKQLAGYLSFPTWIIADNNHGLTYASVIEASAIRVVKVLSDCYHDNQQDVSANQNNNNNNININNNNNNNLEVSEWLKSNGLGLYCDYFLKIGAFSMSDLDPIKGMSLIELESILEEFTIKVPQLQRMKFHKLLNSS
eukprot:gene4686-6581_t